MFDPAGPRLGHALLPESPRVGRNSVSRLLRARIPIGYACGSAVTGVFTTLPGLLLLPYLTDTLGVPAALAGAVVLPAKASDVLVTPWAGRLGDRSRRPPGRSGHLLFGGAATALAFALTFAGVAHGTTGALWTAAAFTLAATAFAFFHASYAALPALLAPGPRARTVLVAGRVAGIAVAALAAGTAAPALITATGGGVTGHRWAGLAGAALILTGTLAVRATATAARPAPPTAPTGTAPSTPTGTARPAAATAAVRPAPPHPWTTLRTTPRFAALAACAALQVAATGCLLAGGPYFAEHALGDKNATGALVAAFVLPNLLTTPWWARRGSRLGPHAVLRPATLVFAAGCLLLAATPALPAAAAPLVLFAVGTGHAGQLLALYALLAEECAGATRTGRPANTLSGLFGAAESLGLATGPFLYALVLQASGYVSSDTGRAARQSTLAQSGIVIGMTLLPALAALCGLAVLHRRRPATPPAPVPESAQARL
ncbi:MFS transporter [Streptomyces fuscichromogenes]|uniref:MFS transporter n=1 Tax=Streptomyces fuscichromogenes TaxID=1324013 RepID=UPI003825FAB5